MTQKATAIKHYRIVNSLDEVGSQSLYPVTKVNSVRWPFNPYNGVGLHDIGSFMAEIDANREPLPSKDRFPNEGLLAIVRDVEDRRFRRINETRRMRSNEILVARLVAQVGHELSLEQWM